MIIVAKIDVWNRYRRVERCLYEIEVKVVSRLDVFSKLSRMNVVGSVFPGVWIVRRRGTDK
jgi:hypothetical protein